MEHSKYEAKTRTSYNNSRIESRFKVLLFLIRIGGIPLNMKPVSRLYIIYNASITVCFYISNICAGMDLLVNRHKLSIAMKNVRMYLEILVVTWVHFSVT